MEQEEMTSGSVIEKDATPNKTNSVAITESELHNDSSKKNTSPKESSKKIIAIISISIMIIGLVLVCLAIFSGDTVSEEFEELKGFIEVEKEGRAKTYTNEAIEKYVKWAYGDEWYFVEENPYGNSEKSLKFARTNGDYFHAIIGYLYGIEDVLPDENHYYKTYRDTYGYEILKNHKNEIVQLAERLSLDADIVIEDRDPATNAYIVLNNVKIDRDSEKIAKFMVEASEIVEYNINPDMKKNEMGLNVTINLSGGRNEP